MDTNRRVAALAVVVVLSLGSPLAAAGWEMPARWVDSGEFLKDFTRVLNWFGFTSTLKSTPSCDRGASIDPNGCPKALNGYRGSSIDPNGAPREAADGGMSIDPNGRH
ncbi:MAG TPA: hypothetical protein VGS07_06895 [Thermoanaerobaculia bacterium]|jgi:hypothetical protein|nr:hypothetical protein [Thermoanaerobaculia bacterium]